MTTVGLLRESLSTGHIKGSMVRAHLQWVRERHGQETLAEIYAALPVAIRLEIGDALAATWCSFEALIRLDRAIAAKCGVGEHDLMRQLGSYSAFTNLSTVYRAFRREDIHEFFRRSALLHRQFQDFGTSEYERVDPNRGVIRILDAECFSPTYCLSALGYYEQAIAFHGGLAPVAVESTCRCAGDRLCIFELRWS